MNMDVLENNWDEIRDEVKKWWGRLTEEDLDQIGGNRDKLVRIIQHRYGYSRERIEKEIGLRLKELDTLHPAAPTR